MLPDDVVLRLGTDTSLGQPLHESFQGLDDSTHVPEIGIEIIDQGPILTRAQLDKESLDFGDVMLELGRALLPFQSIVTGSGPKGTCCCCLNEAS